MRGHSARRIGELAAKEARSQFRFGIIAVIEHPAEISSFLNSAHARGAVQKLKMGWELATAQIRLIEALAALCAPFEDVEKFPEGVVGSRARRATPIGRESHTPHLARKVPRAAAWVVLYVRVSNAQTIAHGVLGAAS